MISLFSDRLLGVWQQQQKAIALEGDEERDLFIDYAIYGYRPHGFNMTEKYLRLFSKQADDFELSLLRQMRSAHYTIYQVEATNGTDRLQVVDVFSKIAYTLVDHQLAKTAYQRMMLAGYLVDFDGFSIQTGGTVLLTREILEADEMARVIDQIEDDQLADFLTNSANGAKLARAVVSATLRLEQAKGFKHQEV